jgi:uncharacterized membrane protein YdjX (TVP38/TMEM64 family)
MRPKTAMRIPLRLTKRVALWAGLLALILVPFALYGDAIEAWTEAFVDRGRAAPLRAALVLGGLLAGDILLPVPSSLVSTACGLLLGAVTGTLVSLTGMTVSCIVGFWLARLLGRPFVSRFSGTDDLTRMESLNRRYGVWALIIARPIPVLAEASVLVIGLGAMPFPRFLLLTSLSNLGVSLVYGVAGAMSGDMGSMLPALGASILLPWLLMRAVELGRRKTQGQPPE